MWLVIPTITLLAVASYFVAALTLHANPPVLAIQSQAMQPAINSGDLVLIKAVDISTLRPGDVLAIRLTKPEQIKYSLPSEIVRRIVKITPEHPGEIFVTKGDSNPSDDPFTTTQFAVAGKVIATIPYLGFPILFFSSKQGIIFLIASAIILLVYYILGFLEDRRHYAHATAATIQDVLEMVGHVHDAVQEKQVFSLEQLTHLQPEQLKMQSLYREGSARELPAVAPEPHTDEPSLPVINDETRTALTKLVALSNEFRQAADWTLTGELTGYQLRDLFLQAVTAIEALRIAFGEPEITYLPDNKFDETLDEVHGYYTDEPNTAVASEIIDEQSSPHGEKETIFEHDGTTILDQSEIIDEQSSIFDSQNSIFDSHDNVFDETRYPNDDQNTPAASPNKRHRRRSVRRRDG